MFLNDFSYKSSKTQCFSMISHTNCQKHHVFKRFFVHTPRSHPPVTPSGHTLRSHLPLTGDPYGKSDPSRFFHTIFRPHPPVTPSGHTFRSHPPVTPSAPTFGHTLGHTSTIESLNCAFLRVLDPKFSHNFSLTQ